MKKIYFVVSFLIATYAGGTCWAQVVVGKTKVQLTLTPGQTVVDSIKLNNTTSKPVGVRIYMQDFQYIEPFDGSKKFLPPSSTESSCASWVTVSPQQLTIPAYGRKEVNYTVKVPHGARGGHYGILFFEQIPEDIKGRVGLQLISRVGCLFFLETADKQKKVEIEDVAVEGENFQAVFANNGDVIIIPQGTFYIMDSNGMVADRGSIDAFYLPPGQRANFVIGISSQISPGSYTAVVTFDLNDGDIVVREIDFSKRADGALVINTIRE